MGGSGDITVWINSPGGDCVAAAQIYNMLMDYPHNVIVKIDGIAASAASVIAMAGTKVLVSPVSMMMIHNPMTVAMGDTAEMQKAIEMLGSVKDSIINAYEIKTGLSRAKLSHLMDAETWMDANKAVELGFADDVLARAEIPEDMEPPAVSMLYSKAAVVNSLMDTILGRPVRTSAYMPAIAASAKTIAFGDFSYYWIADRQGRSFKRLNELYAANGQVGFLASQRVDGKMILPEAVKVLVQKAS